MPDTGERREIAQRVNAKESETVQESKTLVSKTRQFSNNQDLENLKRRSKTTKRRSHQKGNSIMNWDQVEGKWKQMKGAAKEKWGKLTDDDLDRIAGKRERLTGRLQECYGLHEEVAEKQCDEWCNTAEDIMNKESAL
jgi:uncharacterized protein YjbJ (UPF0337 family)